MAETFKPGKYTTQPSIGDIVTLASISTRDMWHMHRHKLLWKEYEVLAVAPARPEEGALYKGWWNLKLKALELTEGMRRARAGANRNRTISSNGVFILSTCQIKMPPKKKEAISFKYNNRSRILDKVRDINLEMGLIDRIQIWNDDKNAWREIHNTKKYNVQWRNLANDRPKWKDIATVFPFKTIQTSIEFRVEPNLKRREFNKIYQVRGRI